LDYFTCIIGISTKKKRMSSLELSSEFELRQKTCRAFKQKLQEVMKSNLRHPLSGITHVDEFVLLEVQKKEKKEEVRV
jgi:hypothetical protein